MAATLDFDTQSFEPEDPRGPRGIDALPTELLAPIVAGAFARGVADTLALLNVPALFLDREGRVIFVGELARPILEGGLQVRSGHLLARARRDNRGLADFVAAALQDAASRPSVRLDSSGLTLRALPAPGGAASVDQLLHAVVLIEHEQGRTPAREHGTDADPSS